MRRVALAAEGERLEHRFDVRRINHDGASAVGLRGEEPVDGIRGDVGARKNLLLDFLDASVKLARLRVAGLERFDKILKAEMLGVEALGIDVLEDLAEIVIADHMSLEVGRLRNLDIATHR